MASAPTDQTGLPKLANILYQASVEFPINAYSVPRVPDNDPTSQAASTSAVMPHQRKDSGFAGGQHTISDSLAHFIQSGKSVSELLAQDPELSPGDAWKELVKRNKHETSDAHHKDKEDASTHSVARELDLAYKCGKWGETRPSDLFLRIYHDSLCTLNNNPADAMASPSLLGSSGTVPLLIVSIIPDIMRHMSNLIVRAEKEVFLATNFWQQSTASKFVTDAMKEASRRHGERGTRLTMKILYDRGSPKQLFEPHYIVSEKEYIGKAVGLPAKHEIPNIDLEVMNYHDPLLGTFHSKFCVVDRKIGIVQSNNIQDNDNLEMMAHVEGPIVDSLYDMALLSWHKKLTPSLPMISLGSQHAAQATPHGAERDPEGSARSEVPLTFPRRAAPFGIGADTLMAPESDKTAISETANVTAVKVGVPAGNLDIDSLAVSQLQISTQGTKDTSILPEHTHKDPHYDADIAGEVARVQAAVSAKPNETQIEAITRHLNHTVSKDFKSTFTAPDITSDDEAMTPYILLPAQKACPIAMVNRPPYGPPNHHSVSNPQNAAWLSAMQNAERNVFIQSPTLNAEPLVPAIIEACERGVDVYAYICLGYNDSGELLPMQGGHNEMIAAHLYERLTPEGRKHLHYYWYIGKDQTKPIIAEKKKRSCHIKLMIVDERIAIVGSGNQDTQSWYHSQEVNLLIESADVCATMIDGLRRNQNTHRYGALNRDDGVWRDRDGKEADGAIGVDPGKLSWLRGVKGAIQRVQGTGGF